MARRFFITFSSPWITKLRPKVGWCIIVDRFSVEHYHFGIDPEYIFEVLVKCICNTKFCSWTPLSHRQWMHLKQRVLNHLKNVRKSMKRLVQGSSTNCHLLAFRQAVTQLHLTWLLEQHQGLQGIVCTLVLMQDHPSLWWKKSVFVLLFEISNMYLRLWLFT